MKEVPLSEIKDDLSRFLREAERAELSSRVMASQGMKLIDALEAQQKAA
jgi:hypothetical protein